MTTTSIGTSPVVSDIRRPGRVAIVRTIARKMVQDRWVGMAIGAGLIGLFLWMGMAIYRQIDISLYLGLPEVFTSLFGIAGATDAATLAYGAVYRFYGAVTVVGIAIAAGAQAIAGEERAGTIGLLLANPVHRREVLLAKAGGLLALVAIGVAILWTAGVVVPWALGVDLAGLHVAALMIHLYAAAAFFGFMAFGIGAATGRASFASGVTGAILLVSFLAAGILPLISSLADLAKLSPWYWYAGTDPVRTGLHGGYLGLLVAGAVVFAAGGAVGLDRRDLRGQGDGSSVIDRLRSHPVVGRLFERLAGSARVSAIWVKSLSDNQAVIVVALAMLAWLTVIMGPMYNAIDETLRRFTADMPEVLRAMVGQADMATPEGWFQGEVFAITAPAVIIAITATMGARAIAGEEQRRTLGLLLANPVSRRRLVLEKTAAMVVAAAVSAVVLFGSVLAGSWPWGLELPAAHVAAASVLAALFGIVIGALALLGGALTGRVRSAGYGAAGIAFAAYLVDSFFPLSDTLDDWVWLSPYHYYLGGDPLTAGMPWGDAAVLVALFVALVGAATVAFERRDIRLGG